MCGDYDGRMGKLACLNFRGLKEKNNKHSQTVANLPLKIWMPAFFFKCLFNLLDYSKKDTVLLHYQFHFGLEFWVNLHDLV